MSTRDLATQFETIRTAAGAIRNELAKSVVGQSEAVEGLLMCLLTGAHALMEGVPGTGKTALATELAGAIGGTFHRIPFTPDLMPVDIIGSHVIMESAQGRRMFEFREGPLFANVVLADQLNRGTPRTQSALLEALEGDWVSVGTERFRLPQPFMVLGAQNPPDSEGTFPLPDAQLDRFLVKLCLTLPGESELDALLQRGSQVQSPAARTVVALEQLVQWPGIVRQIGLSDAVRRGIVGMTLATHPDSPRAPEAVRRQLSAGISPRGALALAAAGRACALLRGRLAVAPDDVRQVARPVLRHRLKLSFEAQADGVDADALIDEILSATLSDQKVSA